MSTETLLTSASASPAKGDAAVPVTPPIPENWKPLVRELTTYYRHLPELLREGEANRYVVVQGDQLYSTWDTYRDANQYGSERFGDQLFMVHQVDARDLKRLAPFFPAPETACPD